MQQANSSARGIEKGRKIAGTKLGGLKARETCVKRYGKDYFARIGAIGGRNGTTGGFAANPELAREAGRKGGKISKRGKSLKIKTPEIDHGIRRLRSKNGD